MHTTPTYGSDRRIKYNISQLSDSYEEFFNALQPSRYGMVEEETGEIHCGFIAQEVEQALLASGMKTTDFAGLTKPYTEEDLYSLKYAEFIALNTWQIQKLKPRMTAAEQEIENLKLEIQQLRLELENLKNS